MMFKGSKLGATEFYLVKLYHRGEKLGFGHQKNPPAQGIDRDGFTKSIAHLQSLVLRPLPDTISCRSIG